VYVLNVVLTRANSVMSNISRLATGYDALLIVGITTMTAIDSVALRYPCKRWKRAPAC